ncbi:MAG: hypothetical protein P8Z40_12020, partial [Chloroflexota bacterium]
MATVYKVWPIDQSAHENNTPGEGKKQVKGLAKPRVFELHRWLCALLLLTALKGWLWAAVFPVLQSSDEIHHIIYARDIVRYGTLVVEPRDYFSPEEVVALEIARTVEVSGYHRPLDLSPARIEQIEQVKALLRNPDEYPPPAPSPWVQYFTRNHPPLYYAIGALLEVVARPLDLLEHLALGRLFSVLCCVGTVGLAYLLTQEVFPTQPHLWLATAILVSFLPMVTYLGSVYTKQALETTLFTAILWMLARVIRLGLSWPRAFGLGFLLSVGLLTKASLMTAVALVAVVALYDLLRTKWKQPAWILTFLLPAILASPWYLYILKLTIQGLPIRPDQATECPSLLMALRSLPIGRNLLRLWDESVASFGHRDTLLPQPLYLMTLVGVVLAVVGWLRQTYWTLVGQTNGNDRLSSQQWLMAGVCLLACLAVSGFHFLRAYSLSCSELLELQGRQVTVIAAGSMLFLLMGWLSLAPQYWRWLLAMAILLCVALNSYSLIDRVIWRYYGSQQELAIDRRESLSEPLTTEHELTQCLRVDKMALNRLDIWLQKERDQVPGELRLRLTDGEGHLLTEAQSRK